MPTFQPFESRLLDLDSGLTSWAEMRPALPDKFGGQFWFLLSMIALWSGGTVLGLARGWGYQTSVAVLFGLFSGYQLVQHIRAVRLGQKLKRDPEMSKLYYGQKN